MTSWNSRTSAERQKPHLAVATILSTLRPGQKNATARFVQMAQYISVADWKPEHRPALRTAFDATLERFGGARNKRRFNLADRSFITHALDALADEPDLSADDARTGPAPAHAEQSREPADAVA